MNILLLSNSAPDYYRFFNPLVQRFSDDGHSVDIAVDSNFSRSENKLNQLGFPIHEFSSFFAEHKINNTILERYKKYNLNAALLSDFERAEVYGLWGERDIVFFETLKSALLSYYENIVLSKKIEVVLYECVSNTFSHFAFFVCQESGITYRGLTASRLPGRFSITSDPLNTHNEIENTLSLILGGKLNVDPCIRQWCEQYLDNIENITPDYMSFNNLDNLSLKSKYFKIEKIRKIFKAIKHINDDHYHSFQINNPINYSWKMFKRSFLRKLRVNRVTRFYQKARENECFLLYPLHFHPESSTSILAATYLNELEVIKNIAFNLPQGNMLYVKDHISAYAYPSLDFYKKISSLPNVRLLSPNAPTKELIRKSLAVITLTSTVGYEALLLGTRVFLLGRVFYEIHPDVVKIKDPANLFNFLSREINIKYASNRKYNIDFVAAYYLNTKDGVLNMMQKDDLAAKKLAEELYSRI